MKKLAEILMDFEEVIVLCTITIQVNILRDLEKLK